jgi:1-acyl-sn-glycerol-3-phosphate acyltransferase
MHSEVPSPEFIEQSADPPANAGGTDLNSEMTVKNAAQSSIRRGPRIIGKLLFAWSWFVAGALLLFVAPPVLLIGGLARRQDWIYSWADWGARTWLRLSGVKLKVTGQEHLDPNQTYVFVANHWSYLDAAPLFCGTGRRMGLVAKMELLKAPILGFGMGFVNVIAIDRSNRERAVETLKRATELLRSGVSFGVCPEGTRARPGEMLPFKKGAFHMAVQAGVPVVPMAFKSSDKLMPRGRAEAWPGTMEMVMLPPVETSWVSSDEDLRKLVEQVQRVIMKELGVTKLSKRPPKPTQA